MSNSEIIEKLAAAIAEEIYIDIAKWHLYLNDAHLHIPLAEKFFALDHIDKVEMLKVLANTKIEIGGGKSEVSLSDLIPNPVQSKLLEILENFFDKL
jgi:hypothetical protein